MRLTPTNALTTHTHLPVNHSLAPAPFPIARLPPPPHNTTGWLLPRPTRYPGRDPPSCQDHGPLTQAVCSNTQEPALVAHDIHSAQPGGVAAAAQEQHAPRLLGPAGRITNSSRVGQPAAAVAPAALEEHRWPRGAGSSAGGGCSTKWQWQWHRQQCCREKEQGGAGAAGV